MSKKIHIKILQILREKNITQKQLSKMIKTEEAVVSRWMSGKVLPSIKSLEKIAKALNVSVEDLLNDKFSFESNTSFEIIEMIEQLKLKIKDLEEKIKFRDDKIDFIQEKLKFVEDKLNKKK